MNSSDPFADLKSALETAWVGTKILQFVVQPHDPLVDVREPYIDLAVAGSADALVNAGLVELETIVALPPCGSRNRPERGLVSINRRTRDYRLVFFFTYADYGGEGTSVQRALTRALMPAIWQPPARSAV